jgi:hypothetical protein
MGGKWKLIIIYWLAMSPRHFLALRREMLSISAKVLTEQLAELIADGIVNGGFAGVLVFETLIERTMRSREGRLGTAGV